MKNETNLLPVLPGKTPPPVPNGFSEPIYGKLRCPSELATFDIIGWFDHPENPHSWVQHIPMLGDIEAWWSLRLGSAIARANGIGGEEIPDGLPDLPLLPKGYARWEYRGKGWRTDRFKTIDLYAVWWPKSEVWCLFYDTHPSGDEKIHFIEAVKESTSDPCESESPKPAHYCETHQYTPSPNDPMKFCPQCEFPEIAAQVKEGSFTPVIPTSEDRRNAPLDNVVRYKETAPPKPPSDLPTPQPSGAWTRSDYVKMYAVLESDLAAARAIIIEKRPLADCYERVCKALGIENDILGFVRSKDAEITRLRAALEAVKSYNEDIRDGKINYRPQDHIKVIEAALEGRGGSEQ